MGNDDLFKKEKIEREKRREAQELSLLDSILILCEGKKTEPNYFKAIRSEYKLDNVEVNGTGTNTDTITQCAIEKSEEYSEIWCVFDRDSFPKQKFNRAFQMIKQYPNIHIAYSNEAFELWYLLHFDYLNTGITRAQYIKNLGKKLGKIYKKNSKTMYAELKDKLPTAIKNAKRLMNYYEDFNPEENNPSTNVYELVEKLLHCGNIKKQKINYN